jgi:dolichol-phosphate mannosyltransferase
MVRAVLPKTAGIREMARFGFVGTVNSLVDVAIFMMLNALWPPGHHPLIGGAEAMGGWLAGSLVGRVLHTHVTFRRRLPAGGYYAVSLLSVAVQSGTTALATLGFGGAGALFGKLGGMLLAAAVSYTGYRWIAYRGNAALALRAASR